MRASMLDHLSDRELIQNLTTLVSLERATTAEILSHIAEVDRRRLYLSAGYSSMYAYCVEKLRLSEEVAYRRIQAARAAREFPEIFAGLADGRLSLNTVILLAPHLTQENSVDLLREASGKRRSAVEELVARRFPKSELLPLVHSIPISSGQATGATPAETPVAGQGSQEGGHPIDAHGVERDRLSGSGVLPSSPFVAAQETKLAARRVDPPPRVKPIAHERFGVQFSMAKETREKLEHAQTLLSHSVPSGDLAEVFDRALDALIEKLEKRKAGATRNPRPRVGKTLAARTIPAHVRREVWKRDQGRCTFVGENGHRCDSKRFLEFDHVEPVARGGQATVEGLRLRCRAHNQFEAEHVFGSDFMEMKRQTAEG